MENICVPAAINHQPQIQAGNIRFVHYSEADSAGKNSVVFEDCAISFVLNGQKELFRFADRGIITSNQGMLIPAGNTLIAEHTVNEHRYSSFIVFFPEKYIQSFLERISALKTNPVMAQQPTPYIIFPRTTYINSYLQSLIGFVAGEVALSPSLALHKLEELFLVFYELFPKQLTSMFAKHTADEVVFLQKLVENNLFNNLTLQQLAFLAHRSVSSFKRDFEQVFGMPPQQYMRDKRMELLCEELAKGRYPGDLLDQFGYENLSNLNTAFKRKYGVTPAAYRQEILGLSLSQ